MTLPNSVPLYEISDRRTIGNMDSTSRICSVNGLTRTLNQGLMALLASGLTATWALASTPTASLSVDRVEGSKIHFKGSPGAPLPPALETGLTDIAVLAHLPVAIDSSRPESGIGHQAEPSDAPWILISAKPCKDCGMSERDLFLIRPTTGEMHQINQPGKIIDPKAGQLIHESKGFYGRCVEGRRPGVFVFQREKVDRKNRLASSFYAAETSPTVLTEILLEKGFPSLKNTVKLTRQGVCTEIPGINRSITGKATAVQGQSLAEKLGAAGAGDDDEEDENDPNLRRATVGSEDESANADEDEDGGESVDTTEVRTAPQRPMAGNQGARVSSPQDSARELKNRITSPNKKPADRVKKL
jgi:hypothetical protein